jgi:2,3-bisphosphoglycerate-dependent phosphoglycerate mutase
VFCGIEEQAVRKKSNVAKKKLVNFFIIILFILFFLSVIKIYQMPHLILIRHGQSEWNLEKKFTGWVDIDLTGQGKLEACKSGEYIKELRLDIDYFYSSFQLRAVNTLKFIQDTLRDNKKPIKAWQLNERHYGALTGLNKDEMKEKLGEDKIHDFRRSWDIKPEPLSRNNPYLVLVL